MRYTDSQDASPTWLRLRPEDIPPANADFAATSIARRIIGYATSTLLKGRISCITGAPGIGKNMALLEFRRQFWGKVAFARCPSYDVRPGRCLGMMLQAIQGTDADAEVTLNPPQSLFQLEVAVYNAICRRSGVTPRAAKNGRFRSDEYEPLAVIFDEAQHLTEEALDILRDWNDADAFSPHPVAFILVGNRGGVLCPNSEDTHISEALGDRLLHNAVLGYSDVLEDDLDLVTDLRADVTPEARAFIHNEFDRPGQARSLRLLADIVDAALAKADGGRIGLAEIKHGFDRARSKEHVPGSWSRAKSPRTPKGMSKDIS